MPVLRTGFEAVRAHIHPQTTPSIAPSTHPGVSCGSLGTHDSSARNPIHIIKDIGLLYCIRKPTQINKQSGGADWYHGFRRLYDGAPRYEANRRTSLNTPPAVTAAPAPGPLTISGCSWYRLLLKEMMLSLPDSCANASVFLYRRSSTRPSFFRTSTTPT